MPSPRGLLACTQRWTPGGRKTPGPSQRLLYGRTAPNKPTTLLRLTQGSWRASPFSTSQTMPLVTHTDVEFPFMGGRHCSSETSSHPHKLNNTDRSGRRQHILLKFNCVHPAMLLGIHPGGSLDFNVRYLLPLLGDRRNSMCTVGESASSPTNYEQRSLRWEANF